LKPNKDGKVRLEVLKLHRGAISLEADASVLRKKSLEPEVLARDREVTALKLRIEAEKLKWGLM
jgi:hypothetical protein